MKLLGLLPIASVVGLLALGKSLPTAVATGVPPLGKSLQAAAEGTLSSEAIGYIGIFSAIFTMTLFGYEVRSLLMCHDYSTTGSHLESAMGIHGQFTWCDETRHFLCYSGTFKRPLARLINDKFTSSMVYSFVFAAWLFVGLKFNFKMQTTQCVWWAAGIGIVVAGFALWFLHAITAEPKKTAFGENGEPLVIVLVERA